MDWRIYYCDRADVTGEAAPVGCPSFGVAVINYRTPDGGVVRLHGRDHYWHRSDTDEFFAGDLIGLIDALSEVEHIDWWGAGRTIATSEFREILSRAIEDADFQSDSTEKIGDPANFVSEPVAV